MKRNGFQVVCFRIEIYQADFGVHECEDERIPHRVYGSDLGQRLDGGVKDPGGDAF